MISYELYNEEGHEPQLQKVIVAGGERYTTNLLPENLDEVNQIEDFELINTHIRNLVEYMKHLAQDLELYEDNQGRISNHPVKNFHEITHCGDAAGRWWYYRLMRQESIPAVYDPGIAILPEEIHLAAHAADEVNHYHGEDGVAYYSAEPVAHTHDDQPVLAEETQGETV